MKPSKKLEGSPLIWDNAHVIEPALGKCIKATDDEFTAVANYLLTSVAIRWPDDTKLAEHEHDISHFNSFLRNAAHRIAVQMLTLMSNCGLVEGGMRLRQKSGFPCIMQQEQSEGVWVDIFDYKLCLEGALTDALNQQTSSQDAKDIINGAVDLSNLLFEDYLDKYTGTSASYDADLVLNGANPDEARNALCATITETVNNYVSSSLELKQAQVDNTGRAALGIGAGIAIIGLLGAAIAFPPLAALLPTLLTAYLSVGTLGLAGAVLGATATGLGIWSQVIKDNDIAPLENEAAVRRVICLWFTQLETEDDISKDDYSAPVDTSEEPPDVQKVWEMITPLIQMELSYAVFLRAWKKNLGYAVAGEPLEDCGCDEATLDITWMGSTWAGTIHTFIGLDGNGYEVWQIALPSTGLNGGDAMYFKFVSAGTLTNHNVKVHETVIVSGGPVTTMWIDGELQTGQSYNPEHIGSVFLLDDPASFPFVIRLSVEPVAGP
jgi:hypothetical protein